MSRFSATRRPKYMCPHCGWISGMLKNSLIRDHDVDGQICPGAGQTPRNPDSDRRPLWKDMPAEQSRAEMTEHEEPWYLDCYSSIAACGDRFPLTSYYCNDLNALLATAGQILNSDIAGIDKVVVSKRTEGQNPMQLHDEQKNR